MKNRLMTAAAVAAIALTPLSASAATFVVDAMAHSSNSGAGTGLSTGLTFNAGDAITISSSLDDLWSAGGGPRWSNANGLVASTFATGTDESGAAAGTQIGQDFGLLTINGFSAAYGSLVGRFADGTYQLFGANFVGAAAGTGALNLFYWDTFSGDNTGSISFDVAGSAVPEPSTWGMMIVGLGAAGFLLRRRRSVKVSFA
jgi:hypothetical protein